MRPVDDDDWTPGFDDTQPPRTDHEVLNERLARLRSYGVLERRAFAEIPPRVEYHLTTFGERFLDLLDRIEILRPEFPE